MITQEELDEFVKEFEDEDPALVNQALEACIELHGRDMWNTSSNKGQIDAIWCWMAGWKKRDAALFTISKVGWAGKWEAGETVTVPDPRAAWIMSIFDDFEKNHWEVADADEVGCFIKWLVKRLGR